MQRKIEKYHVQNPVLKKYIKFFWAICAENMNLNHKIIPVRNIDLKFNLSETPHYVCLNGKDHLLEDVYFSGLHDHFRDAYIKFNGKVDMIGVCFLPEGFYPFLKIPVSEFKNRLLGAREVCFSAADKISYQLKGSLNIAEKLNILEKELVSLIDNDIQTPDNFRQLFNALKQSDNLLQITEFCGSIS